MKVAKLFLAVALVLGTAGIALAEAEFEGDASIGVYNKYIWRGYDLGGEADFLVQPEVNLSMAGFSLGVWGNYNEATEKLDEIDLSLEYSHDFNETVSARIGHIYYSVADSDDTSEIYAGVTLALPVDVDLDVYYDYDAAETWFATLGVSKTVELTEGLGLNLGAAAGYFDFDYLNQGELCASLDYAATETFTVTPAFLFSTPLSQDAKDEGVDDETVASLTLTYSF